MPGLNQNGTYVIVLGTSVILILVITILAAYAFSKMKFKGKKFIYVAILGCFAIPVLFTLLNTMIIKRLGFRNTYAAMIIPQKKIYGMTEYARNGGACILSHGVCIPIHGGGVMNNGDGLLSDGARLLNGGACILNHGVCVPIHGVRVINDGLSLLSDWTSLLNDRTRLPGSPKWVCPVL